MEWWRHLQDPLVYGPLAAFLLTLIPDAWWKAIRNRVPALKIPDLNGPDTATDAAKLVIERKAANCAKIADLRKQIEALEADSLRCDSLVLKGETA